MRRLVKSGWISTLDFRAERRAENHPLSGIAGVNEAGQRDRLERDLRETGRLQVILDKRGIGIAERPALHVETGPRRRPRRLSAPG